MKKIKSIFSFLFLIILLSCNSKEEKMIENKKWDIIDIQLTKNNSNRESWYSYQNLSSINKLYSIYFYDNTISISGYKSQKDKGIYKFENVNNTQYLKINTSNKLFNNKFQYKLKSRDTIIKNEFRSTIFDLVLLTDSIQIKLRRFSPIIIR